MLAWISEPIGNSGSVVSIEKSGELIEKAVVVFPVRFASGIEGPIWGGLFWLKWTWIGCTTGLAWTPAEPQGEVKQVVGSVDSVPTAVAGNTVPIGISRTNCPPPSPM